MRTPLPDDCYLSLPVEITPDLARSRADKINLLFQVQLLGHSVTDSDSTLHMLVDLARELVPCERSILFWREDPEGPLEMRASRGFTGPVPTAVLRENTLTEDLLERPRPVLACATRCHVPPISNLLELVDATSMVSMPLYVGERVMGALQLFRQGPEPIGVDEAHLLRVFTFTFENVLERITDGERARELAFIDRLTGLFNRRYFEEQLEREMDRARRNNEPVSVVLVDVDDFRGFRERSGHATGEALLQEIARALRRVSRKSDTLSRYQDDHFAMILPRTSKESLGVVAQRVFQALEGPFLPGLLGEAGKEVQFSVSAISYPEDAFSPESALQTCYDGLAKARTMPGKHYHQYPSPVTHGSEDDILDMTRVGLFREPLFDPSRFLRLFARLCLDTVPAERISIMVREGDDLVIQVAFGFEGQEEIIRTTRVPLNHRTVSAWVAQKREPLLVQGGSDLSQLPANRSSTYRGDSFFSYPLLNGESFLGVIHFSNRFDGNPFTWEDIERFEPLANVVSSYLSLSDRFGMVQEEYLRDSLYALVDLMESQVPGMEGHSREVAELAEETAKRLGYDEDELERIRVSARLHDLGKVSYRTNILSQPRALSPRETALTQRHPLLGWKYLEEVPLRRVDREAILYHHEREDGSGYLHKPSADVPWSAKILAVADVFQALTSSRPYRPALPLDEALQYLGQHRGTLFDPRAVDALQAVVSERSGSA